MSYLLLCYSSDMACSVFLTLGKHTSPSRKQIFCSLRIPSSTTLWDIEWTPGWTTNGRKTSIFKNHLSTDSKNSTPYATSSLPYSVFRNPLLHSPHYTSSSSGHVKKLLTTGTKAQRATSTTIACLKNLSMESMMPWTKPSYHATVGLLILSVS